MSSLQSERLAVAARVLDTCDQLLREKIRIAAALADLPGSWGEVRRTLKEWQAIVAT